jgi:hypothetical protein
VVVSQTAHKKELVQLKKGIMSHLRSNHDITVDLLMQLDKDLLAEFLLHVRTAAPLATPSITCLFARALSHSLTFARHDSCR